TISMTRHGTAGFYRVWRSHLWFSPSASLAPTDAPEERADFRCGTLGVLAVRKVSDAWKQREIEIGEGRAEAVGPGIGKQRVMLRPADAGRHFDRREPWHLALHHPDSPVMRCAVMRKAAGEVAGLEEIVGEGFQDIVEGILAMRPGFQKVPDIHPAAFGRRAAQGRRHLHLIERLIPDVVEPLRLGHSRADAGIDEIEEEQSG